MPKATIALNLIMRNESKHIDRLFGSLHLDSFDQIVVVDTGSTDDSIAKVKAWQEKFKGSLVVLEQEWKKDFSAARQYALDNTTTDYMMWADLDDTIDGTAILRDMVKRNPHVDSFMMKYNYVIVPDTHEIVCELQRERLVKRGRFFWKGRLHEVLLTDTPYSQVLCDEIVFNHYQDNTNEIALERKLRNLDILLEMEKDDPKEPRTAFYLGNAYTGLMQFDKAKPYYLKHVATSGWDDERFQSFHRLAKICLQEGNVQEARQYALQAIDMKPHNPLGYYVMAEVYARSNNERGALEFVENGLGKKIPMLMAAENPSDFTYLPKVFKFELMYRIGHVEDAASYGQSIYPEILDKNIQQQVGDMLVDVIEQARRTKLERYFKEIREYLIMNDQPDKAVFLTKAAPYTIEHRSTIKRAKIFDEKNFQSQRDYPDAMGCNLSDEEILKLDSWNPKALWMAEWLANKPNIHTILDVGCNWGWFGFWLESKGYEVTGVDINPEIVALAREKASDRNSECKFFTSEYFDKQYSDKKFDLVMAFDIIEHVPDPRDFVAYCMGKTKEYTLFATPHGCYGRGLRHDAADGTNQPHRRVYTNKSLYQDLNPYFVEDIAIFDHDRLQIAAVKAHPYGESRRPKIAFYCGSTPVPWGPDSLIEGVGGSEEAVIQMARRFVKLGWQVFVFNPTPYAVIEGVQWLHPDELDPDDFYDVLISWRNPIFPTVPEVCKAAKRYVWMHDVPQPGTWSKDTIGILDGIFVLSQYHKGLLPDFVQERVIITGNGLDWEMINSIKERANAPHKMVWTSSYLRGLEAFLRNWPAIREEVPDAELHVMYGWETTDANPPIKEPMYSKWKSEINALLKQDGIFHYGRIGQRETLEKMAMCGVFPYLTIFPEISCISVMKAQAMGAVPFTSDTGALKENNRGGRIESIEWGDNKLYANFIQHMEMLIDFLKDADIQDQYRKRCLIAAHDFDWDKIVEQWVDVFQGGSEWRLSKKSKIGCLVA